MAFQASAFPTVAAATTELWPSMVNVMSAPWRSAGSRTQSKQSRPSQHSELVQSQAATIIQSSKPVLPECLQNARGLTTSLSEYRIAAQTPLNVRETLSTMRQGTLAAANPLARRLPTAPFAPRQMSTISAFRLQQQRAPFTRILKPQQRTVFGANTSRNLLAHMEEVANKNPNSATAQNAFYQALLRANMGAIVVERYQNGHFASNGACEAAYQKALSSLAANGAGLGANDGGFGGMTNNGGLNNSQLQAIGQAVAASSRGGNVAISRGRNDGSNGAKESPLYVVVEETIGSVIFKWVKLMLYFALFTYVCFALITVLVESLGMFKKVGNAKTDNEAKAEHQKVRFSDVHGCDEAKEELQELVDFLKNPGKFSTLGGKLPKGVLLVGPPGTGKTLLARAVAGEAGVPFFFMSGSEFDEIYVGVGAKRVRELFAGAKAKSPAIIFIDELDAIGGKRSARDASYAKQTLNQLLTELDGFEQNSGVIILAATNFPETLDKALTRPGRFDRNVVVGLPDVRGRMAILKHHMTNVVQGNDVNLETLAAGTPGFSGAELENIINQAAVHASKAKALAVSMKDFEWAKDKVMMGAEKRSMVITDKEKEMTAYHEAGHALVCMFTKGANPLHKITIMPRGMSLGMTMHLPEIDKYSRTMSEYRAHIDICLGGKMAEELIYGADEVTSGVSGDLETATQVAYAMVTQFGMSEAVGNVDLNTNYNHLSSETKQLIESEVRRTIEEGRQRAYALLVEKRKELDLLARALVNYETLDKEEAFKVIRGEKLEGKMLLPSGSIKRPETGQAPTDMPLSPIPGSAAADAGGGGGEPPKGGGVMA
ncbi:i-AAA protease yme1 [Pseudogymnoascus australis]